MANKSNPEGHEQSYFAALPADEAIPMLRRRADSWFETLTNNNYLDKVKRCWLAYHGAYYDDIGGGHSITFGGEQGELAHLAVNHFRNIAKHTLVTITSNRPVFQARATNSDYKSLVQAQLANQLLEYYMREKNLEDIIKNATEQAIVMGSGFVKIEWNSELGEIVDHDEETDTFVREGDVVFSNLSVYDVVFDSTKESTDLDWVITRSWKNKFDVAAKYPELKEDIEGLQTKSDMSKFKLIGSSYDKTTDIPVYEFFHKRTESMPEGRYVLYLDDDICLIDAPMPYRELPVYRISPADILGTPYGYTDMFDLLPIQDGINSLYSTALTNQNAFGVQNIYVPRGADISINQLGGGLNVIEGNQQAGKPEPLNLTQTPPEIFNFMQQLEAVMETLSGISSVTRGNAEAGITSGNALALLNSQSLQFMSGLHQRYIRLIENSGTGLVTMLQDFANTPRIAAIVGKTNRTELKEFKGSDLDLVKRVHVDVGNALAQSVAGRVSMAEQLMQMMPEQMSPDKYINVMNTGRLEPMTEGLGDSSLLIRRENEVLVSGEYDIKVVAIEKHQSHIDGHSNILSDPILKNDPELVRRVLAHITDHTNALRETDPDLLVMRGEQPLGPVGGSPIGEQPQQGMSPAGQGGPQATPMPEMSGQGQAQGGSLPQPAQPAQVQGGPNTPADLG